LAALTLLNDPTFLESARVFAERIVRQNLKVFDDGLEFAFLRAVSRKPDSIETDLLHDLYKEEMRIYSEDPQAATELAQIGLKKATTEDKSIEVAAWTSVCRAILNMSETTTRY
jgi:hypothetical protein